LNGNDPYRILLARFYEDPPAIERMMLVTAPSKKAWQTPEVEDFGSVREKTRHPNEFPKFLGAHDGVPFTNENCPPGLYNMGPEFCVENGGGGTS
jgi:hypothetical protein